MRNLLIVNLKMLSFKEHNKSKFWHEFKRYNNDVIISICLQTTNPYKKNCIVISKDENTIYRITITKNSFNQIIKAINTSEGKNKGL